MFNRTGSTLFVKFLRRQRVREVVINSICCKNFESLCAEGRESEKADIRLHNKRAHSNQTPAVNTRLGSHQLQQNSPSLTFFYCIQDHLRRCGIRKILLS
jgi:hypothetical protein